MLQATMIAMIISASAITIDARKPNPEDISQMLMPIAAKTPPIPTRGRESHTGGP